MIEYETIAVTEKELENFIIKTPEHIEIGLKFLGHQQNTERGPLDVLLIDSGASLVICELKVVEDDNMLFQGIDYYDYMNRNLEGFARAYQAKNITFDPTKQPRLFLIAPSFSVEFLNRCKWINMDISLFTYQCISLKLEIKENIIIFKEVDIPPQPEAVEVSTIDKNLNYITDIEVKKSVQGLINEIKNWDKDKVAIEATKHDISLKVSGKVFGLIAPRRNHYLIYTWDSDGSWKGFQTSTKEDYDAALQITKGNFEKKK